MKRSFKMILQILIVLSDTEEILNTDSDEENKLLYLTKIGYSEAEASIAMERYGPNSSITELTDFICAAQMAKGADTLLSKQRKLEKKFLNEDDHAVHLPNLMIGFGVFTEPDQITQRTLPEDAIGPPYFYYENVTLAPVDVWTEMSRKWWPSWDPRTKLNCLQTCTGSVKLTEMICKALEAYDDEPSLSVQKYVLDECRKWNLQSSEGHNGYHLDKENDRHRRSSNDVSRLEPASRYNQSAEILLDSRISGTSFGMFCASFKSLRSSLMSFVAPFNIRAAFLGT
ncbi:DNA (Cytosine-5)-methyltransferase DRM1/2 isoform 2 [Hibiscus syriacus]|uniref:DNA (Cytosine-5)-methyltransferase DRM1/2 isoform 2 n=1 Tax=Hibiscus syriacus TaxID=106335 RepID=A0A6A2WMW8_HIBSY|nr:DNA (Cytosine-5)-methyltransferase DRM1/2 isoform 2 [Hibiscus syriacus]